MGTLKPLLTHPVIAKIDGGVVAGCTGANHDHTAGIADKGRGWHGVFARMFKNNPRTFFLAHSFPDGFAKASGTCKPLVVFLGVLPMREHAPVVKEFPVDHPFGAKFFAVFDFIVASDHRDRNAAGRSE